MVWPSDSGVCLVNGRLGFDSHFCHGSFSMSSHTSDLNIGFTLATLAEAWPLRISVVTDRPGVSIL